MAARINRTPTSRRARSDMDTALGVMARSRWPGRGDSRTQRRGVRDRYGLSHRRFEKGRDAAGWLANPCEKFVSESYDRARAIALGALTAARPLPNLHGVPLWDDRDSLPSASMPGATPIVNDDELALDASFVQSAEVIRQGRRDAASATDSIWTPFGGCPSD